MMNVGKHAAVRAVFDVTGRESEMQIDFQVDLSSRARCQIFENSLWIFLQVKK